MKRLLAIGACLLVSIFLSAFSHAFTPTYVLTVDVSGMEGYDRVVSDPPGIDCSADSGDCSSGFLDGTSVALAAIPRNGASWTSSFGYWGGACSDSLEEACALIMDSDKTVTVQFAAMGIPLAMLDVTVTLNGDGTVVSNPEGISCSGNTCTGTFQSNTVVALEAIPDTPPEGYSAFFIEWSGDCSGPGPCPLYMDSTKAVTAQFGMLPPPPVPGAPAPVGQHAYWYHPVAVPVTYVAPQDMRPFAIGDTPGAISLRVKLAYADPIDVYVGITLPGSEEVWLLGPGNTPSALSAGLVKWKDNLQYANIDESIFGDLPMFVLPAGIYRLYVIVTPAGDATFQNYDFWETYFVAGMANSAFLP
jgi:hypothetical protein